MGLIIKPSDLRYKYPRNHEHRPLPKFAGVPDPAPFDRDDLYEVLPMLTAVMEALGSDDGAVLHRLEELLSRDVPRFLRTREEVYVCLLAVMRDLLEKGSGPAGGLQSPGNL